MKKYQLNSVATDSGYILALDFALVLVVADGGPSFLSRILNIV